MEDNVTSKLLKELQAMVMFAAEHGQSYPPEIMAFIHRVERKINGSEQLQDDELTNLSAYHSHMSDIVAPAKPNSIYLMQQPATGFFKFLGPVNLVKHLTLMSLMFLLAVVFLALSDEVNHTTINQGIFESSGFVLLLNLVFLLCCAGLGATFSCLHQLFNYISTNTYDPRFNATYWIKIIMGLISGLLISELIPLDSLSSDTPAGDLDKPLMALLGGFSSDLPYRILSRLLDLVEQAFGRTAPSEPAKAVTNRVLPPIEKSALVVSEIAADNKDDEDKVGKTVLPDKSAVVIKEAATPVAVDTSKASA